MKKILFTIVFFLIIISFQTLRSQVLMSADGSYTQNFDALLNTGSVNTWTDNSSIPNIYSQRTTSSVLYAADNGSNISGGQYSYGSTGSTERALGSLGSGNTSFGGDFAHGILLQNTSGNSISQLSVSYTLEQWRNNNNTTPNVVTFWYKISSTSFNTLNPGSNTGWTAVTSLDASSPINTSTAGALDGNLSSNKVILTNIQIPNLYIPNGSFIMLKWRDVNHVGNDHGLAIDDVSINWTICVNGTTYYADTDGDTFGNPNSILQACIQPAGYVTDNADCDDGNAAINPNNVWYADNDGDGFGDLNTIQNSCTQPSGYVSNSTDCNDNDANNHALATYYQDADGDGFGNLSAPISNCGQPSGYVTNSTDCDDNNSSANVVTTWYQDNDNDGFGSSVSTQNCGQPAGYVSQTGDCDDNNNGINPNATEVYDLVDNNCNGSIDEGFTLQTWYLDGDGDGFGGSTSTQDVASPGSNYTLTGGDCNDAQASINPNAQEICDGIDNNCDGQIDNGLTFITYYADADQDGFGDPNVSQSACSQPNGYVTNNTDCNDANVSFNPSVPEICDGIDNNCDGQIDNGLTFMTYYADADQDGYGDASVSQSACSQPSGYVQNSTDCNDANASLNPGATDIPENGIDEDCSGSDALVVPVSLGIYEFTQASACPVLADTVTAQPANATFSNYTNQGGSCTAAANVFNNNTWNTGSTINLNNYNEFSISANSCYNLNLTKLTFTHKVSNVNTIPSWHLRSSIDNFASDIASDSITVNTVLNDTIILGPAFSGINQVTFRFYITSISTPNATWRNDNVSLWGTTTTVTPQTYYADSDGDGYGDAAMDTLVCSVPQGYVGDNTDCDDTNAAINPNSIWYVDADSDGFGDPNTSTISCSQPSGTVSNGNDCDDTNAQLTTTTMYYVDADGDGFGDDATGVEQCSQPSNTVTVGGDCDDANDQIYPGATEVCDAVDNDCDGSTDEGLTFITYYSDSDNDGFGTGSTGLSFCENPGIGFSINNQDCDDTNDQINPNATDILDNGIDENCDGVDGVLALSESTFIQSEIMPNPNNGIFNIKFNKELSGNLLIKDLNGKILKRISFHGNSIEINVTELISGTYFVEINVNEFKNTMKFIKL